MQIYAKTATGYCETEHCILVPANFEKYAKTIKICKNFATGYCTTGYCTTGHCKTEYFILVSQCMLNFRYIYRGHVHDIDTFAESYKTNKYLAFPNLSSF